MLSKVPVSGDYVAHAQTVDTRPIFSAAWDEASSVCTSSVHVPQGVFCGIVLYRFLTCVVAPLLGRS